MAQLWQEIQTLARDLFAKYREDRVPRLAASIAYFGAFALAPLIVLVTFIVSLFVGEDTAEIGVANVIREVAGDELGNTVSTLINNVIEAQASPFVLLTVGTMFLIGAVGAFLQLQDALNTIWNVLPQPGQITAMLRKRVVTFLLVVAAGLLLLVSIILSAIVSNLGVFFQDLGFIPLTLSRTLVFFVAFVFVVVLFGVIFKTVPDIRIQWRAVWLGAIVTAILFMVANLIIAANLNRANFSSVYGAAGSLVVLLLWVYYAAQVLFIGAEITQVYTERYGRRIEPSDFAVMMERVEAAQPDMEEASAD